MAKKRRNIVWKIILLVFLIVIIAGAYMGYDYYQRIYKPNLHLNDGDEPFVYIRTGASFEDVVGILSNKKLISDVASFEWVAEMKKYKNNVKPGRYRVKNNMSNNELVNLLRSGEQEPVKVTFNNVRTAEQLAGKVSRNIEPDSIEILSLLRDEDFADKYGFNQNTFLTMFIPNTYEFYWNTASKDFFDRIAKEYKTFWSDERKSKSKEIGLSQSEVSILASIVEMETLKKDERPRVAGVYMNRLKKGMLLQADPTVVYAVGDFTIKRVLKEHLEYDSPYNTYIYPGLPPGPIYLPSISSIDAVLNYEKHDYLYFCAKEDFSGYHSFAKTYNQHIVNARKYQAALSKRKIMK